MSELTILALVVAGVGIALCVVMLWTARLDRKHEDRLAQRIEDRYKNATK